MRLPVMPPVKPMLARAASAVPEQTDPPTWLYEPKWDGFRCIVFRDGDEVVLGSRNERPLTRYFPEVVEAARAELPSRCVLDGELVVPRHLADGDRLDWESLSQRIHPADSRVRLLARTTPAQLVAFDLLALGEDDLTTTRFGTRRRLLVDELAGAGPTCHVTAATEDPGLAGQWFETFEGAGLDGVVAKPVERGYLPDQRAMTKVKHHRTADCVLIGYRRHKSVDGVGSLLLGLFDDSGEMHMVGGASAFTAARRRQLLTELAPYRLGEDVLAQGEANRWNARKDNSWVPLRAELVLEVEYDQMEGDRFRHTARFLRWRTDRDPSSCTYAQLEVPVRYDLAKVLAR